MIGATASRSELASSFCHCRRVAKRTAKNFYYSFLVLPADVRKDMCALYAYMRKCDDIGDDEEIDLAIRREKLAAWRDQVNTALDSGQTSDPILPAMLDVIQRRRLPPSLLLEVLNGVEMDLDPVEFPTFVELEHYCYLVAGTVGLCCIHIWGFSDDEAPQRAIECGLAFQLTNILRDLAEDTARGRLYLPTEDLDRFGYSRHDLEQGLRDERFRGLMAFELHRAREFYERSRPLAAALDPAGRRALAAMRGIYGGLLDEIERRDYDVFSRRVTLPRWKKWATAARSLRRPESSF